MSNEGPHGSKISSSKKTNPRKIEETVHFTPWEVHENLEFSPYIKTLPKPNNNRLGLLLTKVPSFPSLAPDIETYAQDLSKSQGGDSIKVKEIVNHEGEKNPTFSTKKQQIENKNTLRVPGRRTVHRNSPDQRVASEPNATSNPDTSILVTDTSIEEQEHSKQNFKTPVHRSSRQDAFEGKRFLVGQQQRESNGNNSNYQVRDYQMNSTKFANYLKIFFERGSGSVSKEKALNLSDIYAKTKRGKSFGPEMKSTQDTSESSKEAGWTTYASKNEVSAKEDWANQSYSFKSGDLSRDQDGYIFKGRKIRAQKRYAEALKSLDTTIDKYVNLKTEENDDLTSVETPSFCSTKQKYSPILPFTTNLVATAKGFKNSVKTPLSNKMKNPQLGVSTKGLYDKKKQMMINRESKCGEFFQQMEKPLAEISNFKKVKIIPRRVDQAGYFPSMMECIKKSQKRSGESPTQNESSNPPNFQNFYDPSQTPLFRTLKKTIDGRKKSEHDRSVAHPQMSESAVVTMTDPDDKWLKLLLNNSMHQPRVNVSSRKPGHVSPVKDRVEGMVNQANGGNLNGVKVMKMKILEEKANLERKLNRPLSCNARKMAKASKIKT